MPTNTLLLAIAAGIISAVVFASATTGPMLLRFVLFFLTPITLYLAGLGLGPAAAAIAVIIATLIILALTNPIAALVFAVSAAMPAAMTTRLALLGRKAEDSPGTPMEWYPLGRIIAAAAFFAGLFAALALTLMGGDTEALTKAMHGIVETFAKTELAQIPGAPAIKPEQIDDMTNSALALLPYTLAALSLVTTLLNLWLAGRITLASGRLTRPWPDVSGFTLPTSATFALLAALALSFAGGMPGLWAGGFAGAYMMAFALLGLAVAHTLTRGSPWRNFILAGLYAGLLFFTPGTALVLALAGLAETIFHYRATRSGAPPNTKT
jgi:hypothetical protein